MSLHYLGKHEPRNCVFSVRHRHVFTHIFLENVGGSEQNRSVIANVQSDDLWPSRMHAATRILQEKTHACGVLKIHNFRVHVSLGSADTLVRTGGIVNNHSIAYSLSNISAKNYRNRLMWVESIVTYDVDDLLQCNAERNVEYVSLIQYRSCVLDVLTMLENVDDQPLLVRPALHFCQRYATHTFIIVIARLIPIVVYCLLLFVSVL